MNKKENNKNMNMENKFLNELFLGAGSAKTWNGAASYASTGCELTDQFGKAGNYRGRSYNEVWNDQAKLWAEDSTAALRFPFYLRMITRSINGIDSNNVQRGQGVRDEAFKRLLWILTKHPETFYANLFMLPLVGSWKDLWTLMKMASLDDTPLTIDFKPECFFSVMLIGLNDPSQRDLVLKYAPRIRSNKKCTTNESTCLNLLAKAFAKYLCLSPSDYRKIKAHGLAHHFQRVICSGKYDAINWKEIPGIALLKLVDGNFLTKHNLRDNYINWLKSQDTVKFNGYPYELGVKLKKNRRIETEITVDKQFDNLIAINKSDGGAIQGNVLCAIDTSSSMYAPVNGNANVSAFDVCTSLGIYFSELNSGAFHNTIAMFDNESSLLKLSGTFSEKMKQICSQDIAWGSTNFQSLIDLLVDTRNNHPEIPLEDFPSTLLVVSDMQFNPTNGYIRSIGQKQEVSSTELERTNYAEAMDKLSEVFPKEFVDNFQIVWWNVTGQNTEDVPSRIEDKGTFYISGFDGAVISLLLGGEAKSNDVKKEKPSMLDLAIGALNQDSMVLINVVES